MIDVYVASNATRWETDEERKICADFRHLALDKLMIGGMFKGFTGVNPNTALAVYHYIIKRTLGFGKPYERITRKEIAEECRISVRTAQRVVNLMQERNQLRKMTAHSGSECFYAINLQMANQHIEDGIRRERGTVSRESMLALHKSFQGKTFETMCKFVDAIANTVINAVKDFIDMVKQTARSLMGDLLSMVKQAKAATREHAVKKQEKRAAEPLFSAAGKANPKALMEFWYKTLRDHDYTGIVRDMTGKTLGMAKNWLNELHASGLDDEAIRHKVEDLAIRWKHVSTNRRTLTCTSKSGKNYKYFMTMTPEFVSYYTNRTVIDPTLAKTIVFASRPSSGMAVRPLEEGEF
ncbi:replication protein [Fundidesulfovibrio soli]|uniref:replication protein n=1 Tax=Fundidesulfovibrio soli TaxID=2922716 RepID=UPI001FAF9347|nr:replication protein [Fundidesulfovibrio soli]